MDEDLIPPDHKAALVEEILILRVRLLVQAKALFLREVGDQPSLVREVLLGCWSLYVKAEAQGAAVDDLGVVSHVGVPDHHVT